jgi:hypothetical protein
LQEILEIQRAQDNLQSLLREKEKEIEGLKTNLTKLENEHRGQHTGFVSLSLSLSFPPTQAEVCLECEFISNAPKLQRCLPSRVI